MLELSPEELASVMTYLLEAIANTEKHQEREFLVRLYNKINNINGG